MTSHQLQYCKRWCKKLPCKATIPTKKLDCQITVVAGLRGRKQNLSFTGTARMQLLFKSYVLAWGTIRQQPCGSNCLLRFEGKKHFSLVWALLNNSKQQINSTYRCTFCEFHTDKSRCYNPNTCTSYTFRHITSKQWLLKDSRVVKWRVGHAHTIHQLFSVVGFCIC